MHGVDLLYFSLESKPELFLSSGTFMGVGGPSVFEETHRSYDGPVNSLSARFCLLLLAVEYRLPSYWQ